MHGEPPPYEANNLLVTADADDRPREALPPHGSTGQSSKRVEASAPWLRRQVDDIDPQERGGSIARGACDAPGACGELRTHTPSDATQQTPLVFAETCYPARDDGNATNRSPASGGKKQAWEQSHTIPLRTNVLTQVPVHDHCVWTSPYPRAKHGLSPCHLRREPEGPLHPQTTHPHPM